MSNKTTDARKQAAALVENALEARIEALKKTPEYAALKAEVESFENGDHEKDLWLDADGMAVSRQRLYLDRLLCTDEEGSGDCILAEEILRSISDTVYFHQDDYSQGYFEWTMEVCLGGIVLFNESPERNCYAIYSEELSLKLKRCDFLDEEHGFLLIERAMRERGYFPGVYSSGHCGDLFPCRFPMAISHMTDAQLAAAIEAKIETARNA